MTNNFFIKRGRCWRTTLTTQSYVPAAHCDDRRQHQADAGRARQRRFVVVTLCFIVLLTVYRGTQPVHGSVVLYILICLVCSINVVTRSCPALFFIVTILIICEGQNVTNRKLHKMALI
uniref:(northern house mosquito) hypothetical protein n=1 Tax=Culex pipiens TaxID=7175 RepID=A0A8D8D5S7_CULPI